MKTIKQPLNRIHFRFAALDSREQRVARLWDRRSRLLHHGRRHRPAGFGASDSHVPCVFFPARDGFFWRRLRRRIGTLSRGSPKRRRRADACKCGLADLRREPAGRPNRIPPVACHARAYGRLGPLPHLPPSLGQSLRESDGKAPLSLGGQNFRRLGQRDLQNRPVGPMGSRYHNIML